MSWRLKIAPETWPVEGPSNWLRARCLSVIAALIVMVAAHSAAQALSVVVELPRLTIPDRVFFDTGSVALKLESRATVQTWSRLMKENPTFTATIEGHADERGSRHYNLALAERRATVVVDYLVSLGIDRRRLSVVSFGSERPAVSGPGEAAWAQNRRNVLVPKS